MADADAQIILRAAMDQFQANLRSATGSFTSAMRQMGGSAGAASGPLREHGSVVDEISEKLRHHSREHVQTARSVKRFTDELTGIIGPGNEATHVLASLAGGLAIGGGVGLAIEAVKVLVEQAHHLGNAGREAFEVWATASNKSLLEIDKNLDDLRKKAIGLTPAGEVQERLILAQSERELAEQDLAIEERKKAAAENRLATAKQTDMVTRGTAASEIGAANARIRILREEIEQRDRGIEKNRRALQLVLQISDAEQAAADTKKAAEKAERDREKAAADARKSGEEARAGFEKQLEASNAVRLKWAEKAADEEDKVRLELAADLEKIDLLDADTRVFIESRAQARIADIRQKAYDEEDARLKAELAQTDAEMEADVERQGRAWVSLGKTISSSFAQGMTKALFHASSFEDGIKSIFDGILSAFEKLIEQMIEKWVASAIFGFLGSFGGPVGAFIGSQAGQGIASLDVGTPYVPRDMLAVVHRGERVTTAADNAAISSGRATLGAGGGPSYHFTIQAFDGPDVEKKLLQIRDRLDRNGRWPR